MTAPPPGYPSPIPAVGAREFVPETRDLAELSAAAQGCKGCDLYSNATQRVFGAGSSTAAMMLVGEQPGDQEDKAGAPFVGPAGRLLDEIDIVPAVVVSAHPSAVLRGPPEDREEAFDALVSDLRFAAERLTTEQRSVTCPSPPITSSDCGTDGRWAMPSTARMTAF